MRTRTGFTLLEVILAVAITSLVMAALYMALGLQFRYTRSGHDAVAESQLARGLQARLAADIRHSLAAWPGPTAQMGGATGSNGGGTPPEAGADTGGGTGATPPPEAAAEEVPTQLNRYLQGSNQELNLYVASVPRFRPEEGETQTGISDLRRVSYFLDERGLVRRIARLVPTSDLEMEILKEEVLAPEVVDLRFRYYEPQSGTFTGDPRVEDWDGLTIGYPPLAVEIVLTIESRPSGPWGGGEPRLTTYRSVVALPGASVPQALVNEQTGVTP